MILDNEIIAEIKTKANLLFDKAKDFTILSSIIYEQTSRTIGVTSLKRLFGYIDDERNTNLYTLNTIAIFLGFPSWEEYLKEKCFDSFWNSLDNTVYVHDLAPNNKVIVKYLNRTVEFLVVEVDGINTLQVIETENSSLKVGDIAYIHKIKIGDILEAEKVIRDKALGNYKTRGHITYIEIK